MFATRPVLAAKPGQATSGVPRPSPLASNSSPGAAMPTGGQRPPAPPVPVATPADDDEEDLLPTWDEDAVNAQLAGGNPTPSGPTSAVSLAPATPTPTPSSNPVSSPRMGTAAAPFRLDIGGATSVGRVRSRNEDSYLIHHLGWSNRDKYRDLALTIVADGLGGHQGGDMASGLAINMIGNALAQLLTGAMTGQVKDPSAAQLAQAIDSAIKGANLAIYRRAQADATYRGMASTIAVLLICDGQVVIGHVGDCRVYHVRNGSLTQVTRDQTLAARMVEMGQLTPQQALVDPSRSQVSQAVGLRTDINPASHQLRLLPGDWLIVSCDGLHAHVEPAQLEQVVRAAAPAASYLAGHLVDLANQGGGTDNTTVVAIRCY